MYTGQSQRGLGCAECQSGLGIAPAVALAVVQRAPSILTSIGKLFGDTGSFDQTHQQILSWSRIILANPAAALSGNYIPLTGSNVGGLGTGKGWEANAANALLALRCWAGDQSALATVRQVDPNGDYSNGCGCETLFGCRKDAQAALNQIMAALNQPAPSESNVPIPSQPGSGVPAAGGTIYQSLPGGGGISVPVAASSLVNGTLFGVPLMVWALGGLVLAFSGGHSRGSRR